MNPRDLPEVVSGLIREMHEVHSKQKRLNGRLNRLEKVESAVKLMRTELKENSRSIVESTTRGLEPCLNSLLKHDDHLRTHAGRLNNIENSQQ
jgi:ubiquinone biosynthesis protein UbiJ